LFYCALNCAALVTGVEHGRGWGFEAEGVLPRRIDIQIKIQVYVIVFRLALQLLVLQSRVRCYMYIRRRRRWRRDVYVEIVYHRWGWAPSFRSHFNSFSMRVIGLLGRSEALLLIKTL
jgi:hypothetical protein